MMTEAENGSGPFRAYLVERDESGRRRGGFRRLEVDELPEGEVLLALSHSSLNYKDGLAIAGRAPILRRFPIVPGIDMAGTVLASSSPAWRPGDPVLATGWSLGEAHWGGYSTRARVRADQLVARPAGLSAGTAMAFGTAGLTAMLAAMALEEAGLEPGDGEVVVTGASGGVGSLAVGILAASGRRVVASTGRLEQADYLRRLGAADILPREDLATPPEKGLGAGRWAGAVDSVGGTTLATLLATMRRHGSVASCGLAGGAELHTTVYPFILRGVRLLGIDSNTCPNERRARAWARLAELAQSLPMDEIAREEPLSRIEALAGEILAGRVRGRVVLDVTA